MAVVVQVLQYFQSKVKKNRSVAHVQWLVYVLSLEPSLEEELRNK